MSSGGGILPAVVGMMVVACGIGLGAVTNRRFGHPTFHGPCPDTKCKSNSNSNSNSNGSSGSSSSSRGWRLWWSGRRGEGGRGGSSDDRIGGGVSPTFADLPAGAVVEHIASFLHPCDLAGVAPVCRNLRKASESGRLWRKHCVRAFGIPAACEDAWKNTQQQHRKQTQQSMRCSEGRRTVSTSAVVVVVGAVDDGPRSSSNVTTTDCSIRRPLLRHDGNHHRSNSDGGKQRQPKGIAERRPRQQQRQLSECLATSFVWREAFFYAHSAHARDLLQHAPPQSCVVVVGGRVHDLTAFLERHPGGAMILWEHASTDATVAFERFFHSRAAREIAREFVVWDGVAAMGRTGTLWRFKRHY